MFFFNLLIKFAFSDEIQACIYSDSKYKHLCGNLSTFSDVFELESYFSNAQLVGEAISIYVADNISTHINFGFKSVAIASSFSIIGLSEKSKLSITTIVGRNFLVNNMTLELDEGNFNILPQGQLQLRRSRLVNKYGKYWLFAAQLDTDFYSLAHLGTVQSSYTIIMSVKDQDIIKERAFIEASGIGFLVELNNTEIIQFGQKIIIRSPLLKEPLFQFYYSFVNYAGPTALFILDEGIHLTLGNHIKCKDSFLDNVNFNGRKNKIFFNGDTWIESKINSWQLYESAFYFDNLQCISLQAADDIEVHINRSIAFDSLKANNIYFDRPDILLVVKKLYCKETYMTLGYPATFHVLNIISQEKVKEIHLCNSTFEYPSSLTNAEICIIDNIFFRDPIIKNVSPRVKFYSVRYSPDLENITYFVVQEISPRNAYLFKPIGFQFDCKFVLKSKNKVKMTVGENEGYIGYNLEILKVQNSFCFDNSTGICPEEFNMITFEDFVTNFTGLVNTSFNQLKIYSNGLQSIQPNLSVFSEKVNITLNNSSLNLIGYEYKINEIYAVNSQIQMDDVAYLKNLYLNDSQILSKKYFYVENYYDTSLSSTQIITYALANTLTIERSNINSVVTQDNILLINRESHYCFQVKTGLSNVSLIIRDSPSLIFHFKDTDPLNITLINCSAHVYDILHVHTGLFDGGIETNWTYHLEQSTIAFENSPFLLDAKIVSAKDSFIKVLPNQIYYRYPIDLSNNVTFSSIITEFLNITSSSRLFEAQGLHHYHHLVLNYGNKILENCIIDHLTMNPGSAAAMFSVVFKTDSRLPIDYHFSISTIPSLVIYETAGVGPKLKVIFTESAEAFENKSFADFDYGIPLVIMATRKHPITEVKRANAGDWVVDLEVPGSTIMPFAAEVYSSADGSVQTIEIVRKFDNITESFEKPPLDMTWMAIGLGYLSGFVACAACVVVSIFLCKKVFIFNPAISNPEKKKARLR